MMKIPLQIGRGDLEYLLIEYNSSFDLETVAGMVS